MRATSRRDLRGSLPPAVRRARRRWRETGRLTWGPRAEVGQPSSLGRWRRREAGLIRDLEAAGEAGLRRFGYL